MTRDAAVVDNYMIKLARDVVPIVLVLLIVIVSFEAYFIKHNADAVDALETQNMILQQASAQQGLQFQTFLKDFTAEANYTCMIAAIRARMDNLTPPSPGTCQVTAP